MVSSLVFSVFSLFFLNCPYDTVDLAGGFFNYSVFNISSCSQNSSI